MAQGFISNGAGPQSPFIGMQNGIIPQMTGVTFPVMGAAPIATPVFQMGYPTTDLHVGQFQTTLLRGSRSPKSPEPLLPKRLPALDSFTASHGTSPNVIVNPTNLEVIHHHRLVVPDTPKVQPAVVDAVPSSNSPAVSDEEAVVEQVTHEEERHTLPAPLPLKKDTTPPAVVVTQEKKPANMDDSDDAALSGFGRVSILIGTPMRSSTTTTTTTV